nr:recombinase family protein [Ramlibacter aurantiacus]
MNIPPHSCAAQYIRMSTDQQDLSPDIQKAAIQEYAINHGLQIVATYEDQGKSGLDVRGRKGMQRLLADVMDPACPYRTVLVYDVSRWGRFQNTDASAYYEYHCRLHGVSVVYVAESFGTDSGPTGALVKSLKRAMAAEYSRELAVKARAGQERVIALGYSAGGRPAIGLLRQAVTREGVPRSLLGVNERKGIQSDRIRLVPGPPEEITLLRRIYDLYANTPATVNDLVRLLAAEGHRTRAGGPFTLRIVSSLLSCELFVGTYVWGTLTRTDHGPRPAPPEKQVRVPNAIEPLIDLETWERVQRKKSMRTRPRRGAGRLLADLSDALRRCPELSAADLVTHGCAPSQTYLKTFGSMEAAYAFAGRTTDPEAAGRLRTRRTKELTVALQDSIAQQLAALGCAVECDFQAFTLHIDDHVLLQLTLAWRRSFTKEPAWFVQRRRLTRSDYRLIGLAGDAGTPVGYYLVPEVARYEFPMLLRPESLHQVQRYRLADLDHLGTYMLLRRASHKRTISEPRPDRPAASP